MTCPNCGGHLRVIETREIKQSVRRRRRCEECGVRVTTYETITAPSPDEK